MKRARTVVVSSPKTVVSVDQTHFTLRSAGRKIGRIPSAMIDHLIIAHSVEVTRKALQRLASTGIAVTFLDLQGRCSSRLSPIWRNRPQCRIGLHAAAADSEARVLMARRFAQTKIEGELTLIKGYRKNYAQPELKEAASTLQEALAKLSQASTPSQIMGLEGWAARVYWAAFGTLLRPKFLSWQGRNRRPPKDPANAALSYGYGILANRVLALLEASGLDPWIGFLHETNSRHPALVFDFMEPFRPLIVDRTVLRLFNLGRLKVEHFERPNALGETVHLDRDGRLLLLEALEEALIICDTELPCQESVHAALIAAVADFRSHAEAMTLRQFEFKL